MFLATARMETSDKKRPPHPPPKGLAFCFAESSGFWSPAPPWQGGTAFAVSKAKHEGKRLYTKSTKSLAAENSFVLKSRNEQSSRRGTLSGLLSLSSISPKSIRPARAERLSPSLRRNTKAKTVRQRLDLLTPCVTFFCLTARSAGSRQPFGPQDGYNSSTTFSPIKRAVEQPTH